MLSEKERKSIVKMLSEDWAERYQQEHIRGTGAAETLLHNPQSGLGFVLVNAFARAGGEQAGYGDIAVQALTDSVVANATYDKLIQLQNAPEVVWDRFVQICNDRRIGVNQKINEGAVKGIVKLASNSVHSNPFEQLASKVVADTVGAFMLLRNIHGIGDKVASFITRDVVTILGVEGRIAGENQILLQPVDRWIRGIASFLWTDLEQRAPFWLTALKVVTKCKEYSFSPVRFNQGAWKYGSSAIVDTERIPQGISNLVRAPT